VIRRRLAIVAMLVLAARPDSVFAQRSYPNDVISRLRDPQPLTDDEIGYVLKATREFMAYMYLRLSTSPDGEPGIEHLIGSDGRPLLIRSTGAGEAWPTLTPGTQLDFKRTAVILTHYTRHAATRCDGTITPDELVVEYREAVNAPAGWTATAHVRAPDDTGGPAFAGVTGELALQDAGRTRLGTRRVRELTDGTQTWWIDESRLLLVGWSSSRRVEDVQYLVYGPNLDIPVPKGVRVPDCVR
jgi:hypothetical protein